MIAYTALETFIPPWDPANEIVTLDGLLCPDIFRGPPTEEGWNYLVLHDIPGTFFDDLDYLLGRIEDETEYQILALLREPTQSDVLGFTDERFDFKGYDLVEDETRISALTNCGGFPLAFSDDDVSPWGLVPDHEAAYRIRALLKKSYPDEHHADCAVWAIWRMKGEELHQESEVIAERDEQTKAAPPGVDRGKTLPGQQKLAEFFRESLLAGANLDLTRDTSPTRIVSLAD